MEREPLTPLAAEAAKFWATKGFATLTTLHHDLSGEGGVVACKGDCVKEVIEILKQDGYVKSPEKWNKFWIKPNAVSISVEKETRGVAAGYTLLLIADFTAHRDWSQALIKP